MIEITPQIALDESEIHLQFVRSSGPGGQNVNKVATAVQLRFDLTNSPSLDGEVRQRLISLAGGQVTEKGVLIIDAQRYRTQGANRRDAIERLVGLVRRAAKKPALRRQTRPSHASKERRLEIKHRRSRTKSLRRSEPQSSGE